MWLRHVPGLDTSLLTTLREMNQLLHASKLLGDLHKNSPYAQKDLSNLVRGLLLYNCWERIPTAHPKQRLVVRIISISWFVHFRRPTLWMLKKGYRIFMESLDYEVHKGVPRTSDKIPIFPIEEHSPDMQAVIKKEIAGLRQRVVKYATHDDANMVNDCLSAVEEALVPGFLFWKDTKSLMEKKDVFRMSFELKNITEEDLVRALADIKARGHSVNVHYLSKIDNFLAKCEKMDEEERNGETGMVTGWRRRWRLQKNRSG